jgi:hypothetical protein
MIKNKDGSYNKFRISIIALIFIIAISITGTYILQTIEFPEIKVPSWTTPTPTQIPTPSPTMIPIDPRIAALYNSTNITYSNSTSWNWTYINYTNASNWTYPPEMIGNFTFVAGGGGSGGSGSSANISYAIVVGGGGGGAGYTSVAYINSTPIAPVIQVTPQETSNISQAMSQILVSPITEIWWLLPIMFIIPLILFTMSMRSSTSMSIVSIIGLLTFGFFFNWGSTIFIIIAPIFMIIIFMNVIRGSRDNYFD